MLLYIASEHYDPIHKHTRERRYTSQTFVVNELFPVIAPTTTDTEDEDDDGAEDGDERSDASRSPDEGITSDDELQFGQMELE